MHASIAYVRLTRHVDTLRAGGLQADEAAVLRGAADARLFGDDNADLATADADVLLVLLEETGRMSVDESARISRRLLAITPQFEAPQRLAA